MARSQQAQMLCLLSPLTSEIGPHVSSFSLLRQSCSKAIENCNEENAVLLSMNQKTWLSSTKTYRRTDFLGVPHAIKAVTLMLI